MGKVSKIASGIKRTKKFLKNTEKSIDANIDKIDRFATLSHTGYHTGGSIGGMLVADLIPLAAKGLESLGRAGYKRLKNKIKERKTNKGSAKKTSKSAPIKAAVGFITVRGYTDRNGNRVKTHRRKIRKRGY